MAKFKKYIQPNLIYLFGSIGVFIWSFWVNQWYLKLIFILFTIAFYMLYLKTAQDESNDKKGGF